MRRASQLIWDQVVLLTMLSQLQDPDNLKLQKISFISETMGQKEEIKSSHFGFFRYNLGPYSKEIANDIKRLEELSIIDPETRTVTARGKFILGYVADFVSQSPVSIRALEIVSAACKEFGTWKSSYLVDRVYEMNVPVDGYEGKIMKVRDIPLFTDIIITELLKGKEATNLPSDIVEDLQQELCMPSSKLDLNNQEVLGAIHSRIEAALQTA